MRAQLAFKAWESADFERKADTIRRETVERMAIAIEQETGAAVEAVALRTSEIGPRGRQHGCLGRAGGSQ